MLPARRLSNQKTRIIAKVASKRVQPFLFTALCIVSADRSIKIINLTNTNLCIIFVIEKEKTHKQRKTMATKFYKCSHCGNVIEKVVDSKVPVVCCGEKMEELIPNTVDASGEKHMPVVTRLDEWTLKVEVGSVAHPMLPEHHIAFIYVETEQGGIRVNLGEKPEAVINTYPYKAEAVYEYCNLHGLWKTAL